MDDLQTDYEGTEVGDEPPSPRMGTTGANTRSRIRLSAKIIEEELAAKIERQVEERIK